MATRKNRNPTSQLSLDDALAALASRRGDGKSAPIEQAQRISESLDPLELDWNNRIQIIGGAFVLEALRPVWPEAENSADAAHALLRRRDPELADAVEALAPMLLGRHTAAVEAGWAVEAIERMLELH